MAYQICALEPEPFRPLFEMDDAALRGVRAMRVTADGPGYPCRVSLQDAASGERLILVNHVSHDVETPFRSSHAIYVREGAITARPAVDVLPAMIAGRRVSLRGFGADGMLKGGMVAEPGSTDGAIRELFERNEIATIHIHTAAYGCFLARTERRA